MVVYADVVAVLNFCVDFLLILGTNRLTGFPPAFGRSTAAAAMGGVYGGMCLFPDLRFLGNILWRGVILCLIAGAAFGWNRSTLRRGGVFLLLTRALGGVASGMGKSSVWLLILAGTVIYLLCFVGFRGSAMQQEYIPVTLRWDGQEVSVIALKDTGNTLHDPLTGEQVLVAGADVAEKLLGLTPLQLAKPLDTLACGIIAGARLIPYHAVGQPCGMLLAVRITDATVGGKRAQPLVAFASEQIAKGQMYQMLTGGAV